MKEQLSIFWFRRDLRLFDNAGLYHALKTDVPVLPLFIFDRNILDELEDKKDARVHFIYDEVMKLQGDLKKLGSFVEVKYGAPLEIFKQLLDEYDVKAVYTNHDYEPYAIARDKSVQELLSAAGAAFHSFKDQVIFEKNEVVKDDGRPYTVFTPYSRKWKAKLNAFYLRSYPTEVYHDNFFRGNPSSRITLEEMGFQRTSIKIPESKVEDGLLKEYKEQRNFPGINGTSRLSVHLRFGTISIRELANKALKANETFLNELIWREFYQMIFWHFPNVVTNAFKPEYDKIEWRNNEKEFDAWCNGMTGYPIVDAGMRELNETGFMHNRVRMITASFLTKHLLIDWRWGEAYFAKKLLDYELASNNGGWQWAAGSGCDAAPYFRIFNPYIQTKKFDPELKYIWKWVPEFEEFTYPKPIVVHEVARERCLTVFKKALQP